MVDDNADAAEMMAMLLELDGHDVRVAHDAGLGPRGGRRVHAGGRPVRHRPARTPTATNWRGASAAIAGFCDMYLVAVTGWGQDEDRRRASEAGFDSHLTKPAEPEAVRRVLALASCSPAQP